ncbi:antibiotic ABC transporter ATP-binding protein [Paenibacillus sp. FSL H7-0357]|uniref:ABC transporter ATP-binding protein n=1 Tax=unclassified Paenibacillus TaxID=185978 RepID=UPI0004F7A3F0|nr:ABC transporter ATP-binding protein [Paenibacillus sp. FSL H7-0357]AIQ20449.1 antibiotic ABC transporter ATP-binding protein [Paenibacillus sp. FSL H7-0357]
MLELNHVTKKYKDFTAVKDISLNVQSGERFGLLGPNGAGKSTMVSMISTVLRPTAGTITVDHKPLSGKPREIKKIMGIVPQDLALYQALSTKDNLEFFGSLYGLYGSRLKSRTEEVLDIIGLKERRNQAVSELSGGMKRRVNIGAALMNDPKLLVLDEPTVGIDPQSRHHILETVKKLNQDRGMTVIYTSHYMEEVEYLCKRLAIIDHGSLIALGSKEELKLNLKACDTLTVDYSEGNEAALGQLEQISGVTKAAVEGKHISMLVSTGERSVIDIVDDIRNLGIRLTGFKYEEMNLESLFLQITGKALREE